jgi:nucleoside-diphosphate-sugar epimerase
MRSLVTGASGFIGGHLVTRPVRADRDVRVLLRTSSAPPSLAGLEVESVRGDLTDYPSLVRGCTTVYNLAAARAGASKRELRAVNVAGGTQPDARLVRGRGRAGRALQHGGGPRA